jgi:hypothetical protein
MQQLPVGRRGAFPKRLDCRSQTGYMIAINRRVYSGVWPAAVLVSVSNPAKNAEAMKRRLVIVIPPVINGCGWR